MTDLSGFFATDSRNAVTELQPKSTVKQQKFPYKKRKKSGKGKKKTKLNSTKNKGNFKNK